MEPLDYATGDRRKRSLLELIGDVIVGIVMIVGSLIIQFFVCFVMFPLLFAAVAQYLHLGDRAVWAAAIVTCVLLNVLTFYEFKRQVAARRTLGMGSAFFLLPRGLARISHGRETYGTVDEG